ncbi:MAG TPA: plasma-membrane proton-efflux P-type ATPase [Polaromonas sp.]|uniref:plasma-membrane proton-efflux P-type ATPase n=1 Tax=Polaromonas sp. UBA4122 TaxID=1947074 RepID=UPI000EC2A6B8|nr:plasma-membrane proton-efflux P-type ATPase [Polaromonas sp. UBA4122]HAL39892.1 plasma-membrane proton-efflux P-type ATPase [Polaromonas sp.]
MTHKAEIDARQLSASETLPTGLTSAEARRRLGEFGPNAITEEAPPRWRVFLAKFSAPIPWMLEAAIVLQLGLGQYVEASVVGGLLLFNATLGFIQEGRAGAALAALKKRLAPTALVRRDGEWVRRPASELVPGDAIRLPLGALVPADAALVSGSVMLDQSMLTGESVPVDANTGDTVYAGSLVRRGQAIAEVTATGTKTYFGRAAELVRIAHSRSTEQAAIFGATRNLAIVNGTVAVLIVATAYAMALPSGDMIRLALTALLATIPVALPATFTLSAAFGAQILARRGVLLTRLSAAHEAAAMDVLCADKTGTLTRNALEVVDVVAMPGFDRARVLALAVLASSEADHDPIDAAIRGAAAEASSRGTNEELVRFVPFDPATKISEAFALDRDGNELRITKGAFEVIVDLAQVPADARRQVDDLAGHGHRVIAVAVGPPQSLRLAGLVALSDPPREDSVGLVATLRDMGVRTIMVTGDSAVTAAAIARKVGIAGEVCPPEQFSGELSTDKFGVFARVVPEEKYRLVKALQSRGHVVGMCGDGTNDAPALRQAQIGIAVSSATDVAKAAAGMVMTEPGLAGIVFAVREGRIAFQRLLTYTFNMLVKKIEIVLFLAIGLGLTGHAVMTPALMVLMLMTNDFLAMSLTSDRASPAPVPSRWRMRNITAAAVVLGLCKLGFSTAMLALGTFRLALGAGELQTLAFVTLVFGNQAVLYVVRERRRMWSSKPGNWVLASSVADIAIVSALALLGILMEPLTWRTILTIFSAAIGFALILDQIKLLISAKIKIE